MLECPNVVPSLEQSLFNDANLKRNGQYPNIPQNNLNGNI